MRISWVMSISNARLIIIIMIFMHKMISSELFLLCSKLTNMCVRSKFSNFYDAWTFRWLYCSHRDNQNEWDIQNIFQIGDIENISRWWYDNSYLISYYLLLIISQNVWWIVSLSVLCAIWCSAFSATKSWGNTLRLISKLNGCF